MYGADLDRFRGLNAIEITAALKDLERRRRAFAAEESALLTAAESTSAHKADGHASLRAWIVATTNCSPADASARLRLARLSRDVPAVGEALASAELGVSHAMALTKAHRNPRCRNEVGELADILLAPDVATQPFREFAGCVARFIAAVDPDGAARNDEDSHDARTATVAPVGGGIYVHATGHGPAAIEMIEIFQRFRDAEFRTDWDTTRATHGESANLSHMPRTDDQRRFDALVAIFRAAAGAPAGIQTPEPLVNIVIDHATFETYLQAMASGEHRVPPTIDSPNPRTEPEPNRHFDPRFTGLSETIDGIPIHPADAVVAALIGQVRRVVYDSGGTVIDLGRKRRLFTGSARDAVILQSRQCIWPGCDLPTHRCQADHTTPVSTGGPTTPANGAPLCGRHNRFKTRGYTTRRDPTGNWHTYRPDGTEVGGSLAESLQQAA